MFPVMTARNEKGCSSFRYWDAARLWAQHPAEAASTNRHQTLGHINYEIEMQFQRR